MTDRYAVIGHPIAHSKSPQIHAAFAAQTGQDLVYEAILCEPEALKSRILEFRDQGGRGMNITLPFKQEVMGLATEQSPAVRLAGAANTLIFSKTQIIAHNTDGLGLVRDLEVNLQFPLAGKSVLLLGAGGASYGVVGPLLAAAVSALVVVNRTQDKARGLVDSFSHLSGSIALSTLPHGDLMESSRRFDVVINATSAGLSGQRLALPKNIFSPGALAYDMVYGRETIFMAFARAQAVQVADGLGMLVEQAAEAFYLWRGLRPQSGPVINELRRQEAG